MAKKMNMSDGEMGKYKFKDFLEIFNIFTGNTEEKTKQEIPKATQDDIDKMMGRR
ncbi:MAG: hypothetical protein K9L56_15690 [Clostridiales bacterium]|nr:hypothetical protein [Clostridiales bacterium]